MVKKSFFWIIFLIFLVLPVFASVDDINLTVYVPFNESSGTIGKDYAGSFQNNVSMVGSCQIVNTPYGRGWASVSNSCYATMLYDSNDFATNGNFTLIVLANRSGQGTNGAIFSGNTSVSFSLLVGFIQTADSVIYGSSNSGSWDVFSGTVLLNAGYGSFHCYAVRRNGLIYSARFDNTEKSNTSTANNLINMAAPGFFRAHGNANYFNGAVSQFAYWKRSLTNNEIGDFCANASIFNSGAVPQSLILYSKTPYDLNTSNIFGGVNIIYNATSGINVSNTKLFWFSNSSADSCGYHINGVSHCTFFNKTYTNNYSDGGSNQLINFSLSGDYILPGTYNLAPEQMDNVQNLNVSVGNSNAFLKNRFYNVSSTSQYFDVEMMVLNSSSQPLPLWYCNSSYTTGSVTSSSSCTNFYNIPPTNCSVIVALFFNVIV